MIDLEIKMLFLSYCNDKSAYQEELEAATDKKIKADLEKKIKDLNKFQLELIQQYIEEVGYDLPLEMQCYFTGEKINANEYDLFYDWGIAYNLEGK
tara:strand:- start:30 stop:317 length:288 start_codon:yes stop_codon:yes gene_type:complete